LAFSDITCIMDADEIVFPTPGSELSDRRPIVFLHENLEKISPFSGKKISKKLKPIIENSDNSFIDKTLCLVELYHPNLWEKNCHRLCTQLLLRYFSCQSDSLHLFIIIKPKHQKVKNNFRLYRNTKFWLKNSSLQKHYLLFSENFKIFHA